MKPETSAGARIELFAHRDAKNAELVKVDAYVYDHQYTPVPNATVLLHCEDTVIRMDAAEQGRYFTELNTAVEAMHLRAEAEAHDVFLGEKNLTVNLPLPRTEMDDIARADQFLYQLADAVGAEVIGAEELPGRAPQIFEATGTVRNATGMVSSWPCWPLLIIVCGLLCVNWFLRRAWGLI